MGHLLNQSANVAVKVKGSVFETVFRRLLPPLGFKEAIWAIAHRLCRLIWKFCIRVCVARTGSRLSAKKTRGPRTAEMIREPPMLQLRTAE